MSNLDVARRQRTHSWSDPRPSAEAARSRSGMEFLQDVVAGEVPVPPITETLGMHWESVEEGRVVFGLTPEEFHYNPIGTVHGGVFATLLDSACGCAVHSTLPAGVGYTTLDITVKYLRPVTVDTGPVRCEGEVVHSSKRTAMAVATMTDESGRQLAHATSSCMILRDDR